MTIRAERMIPTRNLSTFFGSSGIYGSASGLSLSQPSNMLEAENLGGLEMVHGMSEGDFGRPTENEFDSPKSGSENHEGASGDDQMNQKRSKKKHYHRHSQHQIQELEAFFKECPHPDDKQRKELSRHLGLEPLKIKFWFQNKRTQMKTQHERHENSHLRAENEKLRVDNMRYRESLGNTSCPNCGGPTTIGEMSCDEQHLRIENVRLREEIDRISAIAAKYVGKPVMSSSLLSASIPPHPLDLRGSDFSGGLSASTVGNNLYGTPPGELLKSIAAPTSEADKQMIVELAMAAMDELVRMARMDEPLWTIGLSGSCKVLNEDEYAATFPHVIGPKPSGFKCEATRETAVVIMNPENLIGILMDTNQWSKVFSGIISRAETLEVLSTGVAGDYHGALQVMTAELHLPTPLVPTREMYFARYCKRHGDGTWAVVDVSLDSLRPNSLASYGRRPSGCLIQDMSNGYSEVTWVENVVADVRGVHSLYGQHVSSGLAFGAKRWVATLGRQCERLASAMATYTPTSESGVITSQEGRRSVMKLAERMVMSFCAGVSASTAHTWTTLSGTGTEDVRIMTRKSIDDPGCPPGIVLSAATSSWLPVPPKKIFDFLRNENSRKEWDILSNGGDVQEMAHITNGCDTGNSISLLRVHQGTNSSQGNMLILQECCTDTAGSFVIYAPVDIVAMNVVLNGGDADYVALLPSGFAILPDGSMSTGGNQGMSSGGSLLTVAFQILVDSIPTAKLSLGSVATVNNLIACTVERIGASLSSERS
ncbi:hypothetical protein MLD38_003055 [Melastoma candidum]|uniref:Uncharacterized protein n=1 Tax=Melastoma candidum TaxID=119954 RepID=A0ACB9S0L4_9MYRT|nr:hypothetical protein MLD38_003055 [Melastoma candidum]